MAHPRRRGRVRVRFREVERFEHFSAGAVHTFVRMVREPDV